MIDYILIGIAILVGSYIVLRLLYGETITGKYWKEKGYNRGYKDGSLNTRMYMGIYNELPTTHWVTQQMWKTLDTREKLLDASKETEQSYE